jgi:hypothetical protein
LYSTSLLRVVLRSNPVAFGSWGLYLLTSQLHDTNQLVTIETASILDEALEDRVNLFLMNSNSNSLFNFYRD